MHSASRWQYWYYHRISRIPHTRYAVEGLTEELVLYGLAPEPPKGRTFRYTNTCCVAQDLLERANDYVIRKKIEQIKMHEGIRLQQAGFPVKP